jgi:hypothetical protein
MKPLSRTRAGNPRHCVVCDSELAFRHLCRPSNGPDVDGFDDGSVTDWQQARVLVAIHCPHCELLYRVCNPDE